MTTNNVSADPAFLSLSPVKQELISALLPLVESSSWPEERAELLHSMEEHLKQHPEADRDLHVRSVNKIIWMVERARGLAA